MLRAGAPFTDETYPNRASDCTLALAPAFMSLIKLAEALGWRKGEVALALATLAENHRQADGSEQEHGLQRLGIRLATG